MNGWFPVRENFLVKRRPSAVNLEIYRELGNPVSQARRAKTNGWFPVRENFLVKRRPSAVNLEIYRELGNPVNQ